METLFTSDLHLDHLNIAKYCGRVQFMSKADKVSYMAAVQAGGETAIRSLKLSGETLEKMNEGLIRNWNERVKPGDLVFHVGDFCFRSAGLNRAKTFTERLNGNIVFIEGNHDNNNGVKTPIQSMTLKIWHKRIFLTHNPRWAKSSYKINLTGHVHEKWKFRALGKGSVMINVGTDVWKYRPVKFGEILKEYHMWVNKGGMEK